MTMWSPHSQVGKVGEQMLLKRGSRVRAIRDLPRVPAGTEGKITLTNGFQWRRYRVRFDNGVEIGSLDAKSIEKVEKVERDPFR